jgi:hypothetical protein
MKCFPCGLNNCPRLLKHPFDCNRTEHRATSIAVFKHFRLQYSLCTVLLTVELAALKAKFLTERVAVPELTLTNHTEFKELNC